MAQQSKLIAVKA